MSALHDNADVAVLGGGPGGYVAALRAAQRGARVVLIEKERVGGTCLNVGCIPTKVLTSVTELLVQAKRAGGFGIAIPQAAADLTALMAYQRSTVEQLVGGVEQLLKARHVTLIRGEARLTRPDQLAIQDGTGGRREFRLADHPLRLGPSPRRHPSRDAACRA
jgi:dihydrolipoamide dehydrogenase